MHGLSRFFKLLVPLSAAALLATPAAAAEPASGPFVAVEGQKVFGDTDVEAGFVPDGIFATTGRIVSFDEGDGWGGAVALGYAWGNGWRAAVRYRRLVADESGGPVLPGLIGVVVIPQVGGFPVGVFDAFYTVDSKAHFLDAELASDIAFAGLNLQLFGGLAYASIDRDTSIWCDCFAISYSSAFSGVGPRIGVRSTIPVASGVSLVGGASVAALFGTSEFTSRLDDPLVPLPGFKAKDDRTVAAIDAEAGIAFAIWNGQLTLGYRVDAILGALDTDQRLLPIFTTVFGVPPMGDREDDFVEHGPFARYTLPLGAP